MPIVAPPLHLIASLAAISPALAGELPPEQRPYVHPLAHSGRDLVQRQGARPTAEFLASVRVHTLTTVDEAGRRTVTSEVVPLETEPIVDAAPAREPVVPSVPWMSPEVSAIVVSPLAAKPRTVDVWMRLRSTEWNAGLDPVEARRHALVEGRIATVADERRVRVEAVRAREFYNAVSLGGSVNYYGSSRLGLVEGSGSDIFRAHLGFDNVNHVDRVENCSRSVFFTCINNNPSVGGDHATAVASVLLGDVTRGQDADLLYSSQKVDRSGVARRATLLSVSTYWQSWVESQMSDPSNGVFAVNNSWHVGSEEVANMTDPTCLGQTSWAKSFNAIYESGVAMFKSAGNLGHASANGCTVSSPAAAIGAFPVSGYEVDGGIESIYAGNSRGGTAEEGLGRSVIGLASPTHFGFPYPHYDRPVADSNDGYQDPWWVAQGDEFYYGADWVETSGVRPGSLCCTSGSTPTAAGAAAVYADWYRAERNNDIDDPGILYANLLLMGDGYTGEGVSNPRYARYDNLWGAGKLRLRRFDELGLDEPAAFDDGWVCVASGGSTIIPITTSISTDVDFLKAVTWWYDRRHEDGIDNGDGIAHDELKLRLQSRPSSTALWTDRDIDSSTDNKQRVALDPGAYSATQWRLLISAVDVTADDEGCGTNAMKVYYAWMYEDSDRESWENLSSVRKEN